MDEFGNATELQPPIMRRSSREQGGMGRDLDGEVMNATLSEPSLHAALADDINETAASEQSANRTQDPNRGQEMGQDEDVVLHPPA